MNLKRTISGAVFILFMLISGAAAAQDTVRNISLNEAIALSIQNSKLLRASRARIDQSTAALREAKNNQLPDLKVSGSYLRLTQPNIDIKFNTNNTGGNGGNSLGEVKVNQAAYGIANLSLPVFSGFRIQYGIRSAEFLQKATTLDGDYDREEVILNTIGAYSNLYKASVNVRLIRENLAQSRSRDSDFYNLEQNGLLARNDRLKAALQTSNIELTLVDAESNLQVAMVNMNLLLGLPEHETLVPDSSSLSQTYTVKSINDYEQLALVNRKDVLALQFRKKASAVGIKQAASDYYPSIALTGGYIAADIPGLLSITNAVTYGVGLSYNLSSLWKTSAKMDQAKARLAEVQANEDYLDDQVRLGINKAYEDYISAQKKIEVSRIAIDQGTENYKITKNKYENSLVTVTDLLDANVALLQAQISLELAKADAIVAYNTLLEKAGVLNDTLVKK